MKDISALQGGGPQTSRPFCPTIPASRGIRPEGSIGSDWPSEAAPQKHFEPQPLPLSDYPLIPAGIHGHLERELPDAMNRMVWRSHVAQLLGCESRLEKQRP